MEMFKRGGFSAFFSFVEANIERDRSKDWGAMGENRKCIAWRTCEGVTEVNPTVTTWLWKAADAGRFAESERFSPARKGAR